MKRTTRSRFDPNTREEDNNLQEDQLLENGATSSSVEPPNSTAKPPSEHSLTPKIASILDNNVYEVPIKVAYCRLTVLLVTIYVIVHI